MAAKQLVFSEDARRKLKHGMNVVADAVSATLGPKGRNVAIDRKFGTVFLSPAQRRLHRCRQVHQTEMISVTMP